MGVNSINSLRGTFDGGGHTLSNFVLSTNATGDWDSNYRGERVKNYSGLIDNLYSESYIGNLTLNNVECINDYSVGIIGTAYSNTMIENINFYNSFNSNIISLLVGTITGSSRVSINNIRIDNSGKTADSYCIYRTTASYEYYPNNAPYYRFYTPSIIIDGVYITNSNNIKNNSSAIIYSLNECEKVTGTLATKYCSVSYGSIKVTNYKLASNIENGAFGYFYNLSDSKVSYENTYVSNSEISGNTSTCWSNVNTLTDSINTGLTTTWGADNSLRVIDAGNENVMTNVKSSIILYPDANGIYTYYSASGTAVTISNPTLINKNLFVSMLGFDETIWDFDNLDIQNKKYPSIR